MRRQPPTDPVWRKSSHSNGDGNVCVEVAFLAERAAMRDSKNPDVTIVVPADAWARLRRTLTDH